MTLLPMNATKQERDIEASLERHANVPVPIDTLWNVDTCPASLLPWLAWAFSVDDWESDWTEAQKREVVRRSVTIHKYKGTRGAIQDALDALGNTAILTEPHQDPTLQPYTFDATVEISEGRPVTEDTWWQVLNTIFRTKNVRSHLRRFRLSTASRGVFRIGSSMISAVTVTVYPPIVSALDIQDPVYTAGATYSNLTVSILPGSS